MKHYPYGGSTEDRTLHCHAWKYQSQGLPALPDSQPAILGNALHEVIEGTMVDDELDPYSYEGQTIGTVLITKQHIEEKIYPALDAFDELMDKYDIDQYWIEEFVEFSDDEGGTADFIGLSRDARTVVIADYKSGDGIMVYAEDNSQAQFYAMCAKHSKFKVLFKNVKKMVLAIVQPAERKAEILDIWETDITTLNFFEARHRIAVTHTREADANTPCNPGEWCAFCPAEVECPAKKDAVKRTEMLPAESEFPAQVNEAMNLIPIIKGWIKAVEIHANNLTEKGLELEDHKRIETYGNRAWIDIEKVEAKIKSTRKIKKSEAYDTKLKSVTQMEKVCKKLDIDWSDFSDFVNKPKTGTKLVPKSDRREAVVISSTAKLLKERLTH